MNEAAKTSYPSYPKAGIPNLWPAGQKLTARPLGVALHLSTTNNEIE